MANQLVMDRFRLLERLGSGGSGTVYRARDQRLERDVAIKEIEAPAETDAVLREAQAAARLNHPAIATLYEIGERRGRTLLVSELIEGETLDRAALSGSVSDRDLGEIGLDLCEALEHAHQRGVVHRDIKPQNVMIRPRGSAGRRAKLMDFGIASVSGWPTMSATGQVIGTLAYMSPEQAEGEVAGPATDVYSLGLTLYEGWAGRNPVARETPAQTARRIGRPVRSLTARRPDLPPELSEMIDACLQPVPDLRPEPTELRNTIKRCQSRLDQHSPLPAAGIDRPRRRREPRTVLALAAAGTALAALAAPLGRPGLALCLGLVALAIAAAGRPGIWSLLIPGAALLGPLGLTVWIPALAAALAPTARSRAVVGGAGFLVATAVALLTGSGPHPAGTELVGGDWTSATGAATAGLGELLDPVLLAGTALFAAAAAGLGVILRTPLPLAFVGALVWAAVLETILRRLGDGSLGGSAAIVALGATVAVAIEWHRRAAAVPPRPEVMRGLDQPIPDGRKSGVLA